MLKNEEIEEYMNNFFFSNPIKLLKTDDLEPFNAVVERVIEPAKK